MNTRVRLLELLMSLVAFQSIVLTSPSSIAESRQIVNIPGTRCGDGSTSFVNVIERRESADLFLFVDGGGSCSSARSCGCSARSASCLGGLVEFLSRPRAEAVAHSWSTDAFSPVGRFNVVEVPYCTGDNHTGDNTAYYDIGGKSIPLHHHGFQNLRLSIAYAAKRFPTVRRVVVLGVSAGGIGVTYAFREFVNAFPRAQVYIISDGGIGLVAPFIHSDLISETDATWGSDRNLPPGVSSGPDGVVDMAEIVQSNTQRFPKTRFALLGAMSDLGISFFLGLKGYPPDTNGKILAHLASDQLIAPQTKYYYIPGPIHVLTEHAPSSTRTPSITLKDWLGLMISGSPLWTSTGVPDRK